MLSVLVLLPGHQEEVVEGDDAELEGMRKQVRRVSNSLGAQRAARARAEAKVVAWEAKVETLRARGEEERQGWAAANL